MDIQLEKSDKHSIQGYSDNEIKIANIIYTNNILVNKDEVFPDWSITRIDELDETELEKIIKLNPEILVIGVNNMQVTPPYKLLEQLSRLKIGFEYMSFGAACRTFNILLGEGRNVVGGFIF